MILITGGLGYIGSHTCVELARAGHEFVILDNLSNSSVVVAEHLARVCGRSVPFYNGDVRDEALLDRIFQRHPITSVIHFAGLKSVGESLTVPIEYFDNNIAGSISLLQAMSRAGCKTLVFSSSANVYGDDAVVPALEQRPSVPTNPYGRSKWMVEEMLRDVCASDGAWRVAMLRYFNPVGAHESALIGERYSPNPSNLMPLVAQVAAGLRPVLRVFGDDYLTPDGSGVRDFIHVVDLAAGHVAALSYVEEHVGGVVVNLGTGRGTSVLQLVAAFERASGRRVPYEIVARREGDIPVSFADVTRARDLLGWEAERDVEQMCRDAWRWQCTAW